MQHLSPEMPRPKGLETEYGPHPLPGEILESNIRRALPQGLTITPAGFLCTGDRLYPDQKKNIEFATGEALSLEALLIRHFMGEDLVAEMSPGLFTQEEELGVYKRTIDEELKTRSDHENYLTGIKFDPKRLQHLLLPHRVMQIIFTGPGFIKQTGEDKWQYMLDQRAWAMGGDICNPSSTINFKKPFIIARSEHFDEEHETKRLQIGSGSQNRFAFPIAFRFGTTSLVLRMIELGRYPSHLTLEETDYAHIMKLVAADLEFKRQFRLSNGREYSAPQFEHELAGWAVKLADRFDIPKDEKEMAYTWAELSSDTLDGRLDNWLEELEWLTKLYCLEKKMAPDETIGSPRTREREIKWHKLGDKEGIVAKLRSAGKIAMMPAEEDLLAARTSPVENTRAAYRGEDIKLNSSSPNRVTRVNWHFWEKDGINVHADKAWEGRPTADS